MATVIAEKIPRSKDPTPGHYVLDGLKSLPPLPQEKRLLLELINDDDVDLRLLSEAIEKCPVVAARIIGLSNAAYFGYGRQCCSVLEATVNVLGLTLVKNITLGIVACDSFSVSACHGFDVGRFWMSSVAGAMFARLLARKMSGRSILSPDDAYLGGLLRDIGLLALVHVTHGSMSQVFKHVQDDSREALLEEEKARIGTDHAEVGAWLCHQWKLPRVVSIAGGTRDVLQSNGPEHQIYNLISLSTELATEIVKNGDIKHDLTQCGNSTGVGELVLRSVIHSFRDDCDEIAAISRLFVR